MTLGHNAAHFAAANARRARRGAIHSALVGAFAAAALIFALLMGGIVAKASAEIRLVQAEMTCPTERC